jgi:hypothetical protein
MIRRLWKNVCLGLFALPMALVVLPNSSSFLALSEPVPEEYRASISSAVARAVAVPGAPSPQVTKITMQGEYGLADWLIGDAGGTVALFPQQGNRWRVTRLPGGVPTASDLSHLTGMPVIIAQSLLNEHIGNIPSVTSYCQEYEQTFLAVETANYWVSICGGGDLSKPTTYVGVAKSNPQQIIRLPLQDYNLNAPLFVAVNGSYTYIVGSSARGKNLTVSEGSQELLREPILRGL